MLTIMNCFKNAWISSVKKYILKVSLLQEAGVKLFTSGFIFPVVYSVRLSLTREIKVRHVDPEIIPKASWKRLVI
jgi:hypothetical protein